jgi:hypothetical protein
LHLPCGASIGGFSGSPCEQKKREMKKRIRKKDKQKIIGRQIENRTIIMKGTMENPPSYPHYTVG